ncbi:MAG: hypothetical protein LQ343_001216 [Gyalolechia ehrenbergii]|nr:MAG: hypothetical protein LQ343_001216 [Gyalolechia ehrenbergii]
MSSLTKTPSNPFEGLKTDQAAPGNDPMEVTSLTEALPQSKADGKSRQGKKRPAPARVPLPEDLDLLADLGRRIKEFDAPQAPPVAVPASVTGTPQQPQVPAAAVEPEAEVCLNSEVPRRAAGSNLCAFLLDGDDLILGGVLAAPLNWEASLIIDAGRIKHPHLTFELKVAHKPNDEVFTRKAPHDTMRLLWHPATPARDGRLMIDSFELQIFDEWYQQSTDEAQKKFFRDEPGFGEYHKYMMTVKCKLHSAFTHTEFQIDSSMGVLPDYVRNRITRLKQDDASVRFWFRVPNNDVGTHISLFTRRVSEGLGLFSQYWDKQGKSGFSKVEGNPSVDQFAGGLYKIGENGGFMSLPKINRYQTPREFMTIMCLTALREAQFTLGRHFGLKKKPLKCFVKSIPKFAGTAGREAEAGARTQEQMDMDKSVHVYVQNPSTANEEEKWNPEAGLRIRLQWDNSNKRLNLPHTDRGPAFHLFGITVQRDQSDFTATGTDFCILLQPGNKTMPMIHKNLLNLRSEFLHDAYIEVITSLEPMERELRAAYNAGLSRHQPLCNIRSLLMDGGQYNPNTQTSTDLRYGFPKTVEHIGMFQATVDWLKYCKRLNSSQMQVIESLGDIRGNVLAIAGPPGTGKTQTMSTMIWILATIGHKVLVVCPSNKGLDKICLETRKLQDPSMAHTKQLRQEIASVEKSAILEQSNDEDVDPSMPFPKADTLGVAQDPRVKMAYQDLIAERANKERYLEFQEQLNRYQRDYEQVQNLEKLSTKTSVIPWDMTMGGHIARIVKGDAARAQTEYEKEAKGVIDQNDILSADERNPSKVYNDFHQDYIENQGKVGNEGRKAFFKLRAEMEDRVIAEQDIIYTSLNNASSRRPVFKPTVIIADEASQASLPAFFVPLTHYDTWEAVILAGDWRQLRATMLSRNYSEVGENAQVSALERLDYFNTHTIMLTEQYRMAESIARFPSQHIYGGLLKTHASAKKDNPSRKAVRRVCAQLDIAVPTEYCLLDVPGTSRREPDGNSLQNWANADVIVDLLDKLIHEGILPEDITIICFYSAQTRLLQQRIGSRKCRDIVTTESYQGEETDVLIVDFVAANEAAYLGWGFHDAAGDRVEDKVGRYPRLSTFARDWHRINVALTRAKHGLFLVAQEALLARTLDKNRGPLFNTVFHMVKDLQERNLVHHSDVLDSHPDAVAKRKQNQVKAQSAEAAWKEKERNLSFVRDMLHKGTKIQAEQQEKELASSRPDIPDIEAVKAARERHKKQGKAHKPIAPKNPPRQPPKPFSLPPKPPWEPPVEGEDDEGDTQMS